jgi:hypothetical protein
VNSNYAVRLYFCSCSKIGVLWPSDVPACQNCGGTDLDWLLLWREQVEVDLRLVLERLEAMDQEVN